MHPDGLAAWLGAIDALVWSGARNECGGECGPQWLTYTGALSGDNWLSAVHPADLEAARGLGTSVVVGGSASAELRIRDARGAYRWFLARASPLAGPGGRWIGVAVDVDDRKRAEAAALERDRHAQALLRLSQRLERAETREEVCQAAEASVNEVTGYKVVWVYLIAADGEHADVYVGRGPAAEPVASRLRVRGDRMMEEIAAATGPVVVEDARTDPRTDKAIVAQLGNRTIVNVPILLPGRRLGALGTGTLGDEGVRAPTPDELRFLAALASHVAVALDRVASVIELRRTEARLAESEERYRQVFDDTDECLILTEILDDGRFHLLSANPAFERAWRLPLPESLGKTVEENLPAGLAAIINERYRRILAEGTAQEGELELDLPTGRRTFASKHVPVRDAAGRIYRIVGLSTDITEKRAAEAALRRLNRTLRTLSFGNETLVRASTESELLAQMCRVLVEQGGYRMSWIGLRAAPGADLQPLSWAGHDEGYLEDRAAHLAAGGVDEITAPALAAGEPRIIHDLAAACSPGPGRDAALSRGFCSAAVLPLRDGSAPFGALTLFSTDAHAYDDAEMSLLEELASDLAFGIHALRVRRDQERGVARLEAAMAAVTQALGSMVELRDPYTAGHQRRVAELSAAVGRHLGLDEDRAHALYVAGSVHDVGKIYVPSEILTRPSQLSKVEFEVVKLHVAAGYEILRPIDFDWPIADIVHQHHERLDGSGYPRGLAGTEILLEARILTVADVVEAMTNHRPYRPALGVDAALQEIRLGQGRHYDPKVVAACVELFHEKGFAFA